MENMKGLINIRYFQTKYLASSHFQSNFPENYSVLGNAGNIERKLTKLQMMTFASHSTPFY
jgi:hypothetical protein